MNERIDDLILLAALGELTDAEQLELDQAASSDPEVAARLDAELETASRLLASTPMAAPATLRRSVLDAIASTPQSGVPDAAGGVTSLAGARRRRARRLAPVLGAAAAVALVAVGSVVLLGGDDAPDEFAAIEQAADASERRFDGELTGTLTVVYSAQEDAFVIDGASIPVPDDDRAYVLWFLTADEANPVSIFRPDDDGVVRVRVDGLDPADVALGITEESVDGSDTPTLPVLATA